MAHSAKRAHRTVKLLIFPAISHRPPQRQSVKGFRVGLLAEETAGHSLEKAVGTIRMSCKGRPQGLPYCFRPATFERTGGAVDARKGCK